MADRGRSVWLARTREIPLGERTLVMGIVNVTPDSFSDGGAFAETDVAVAHGKRLLADGADILDVGGESSRPGSEPVPVEEELRRVIPVVDRLAREAGAIVSVDTTKARVAAEAIAAGACIVNDISALRFDARMADVVAHTKAGVVLMHMLGEPKTMQSDPRYGDVVAEISAFLRARMEAAVAAGIRPESVVLDPGIGFGKTLEHNLEILRRLPEFGSLQRPILVGPSRKAFLGKLLGDLPPADRVEGTAAAVALAIHGGASIVRVHDVRAMVRVARVADAIAKGPDAGG
jgi:dihydropteroate synthase